MKENQLALNLIRDAEFFFKDNVTESPQIIIDKIEYKKYNLDLLKTELNKNKFNICDLENAPYPICKMPLRNKLFIYKI